MKIAVFGLGYVGASFAVLLARKEEVCAVDLNPSRVQMICGKKSPIGDALMEKMLREEDLNLSAGTDPEAALRGADYIVIATNTELNEETGALRTSSVESVLRTAAAFYEKENFERRPAVVIKSTVPIGYTKALGEQYPGFQFLFCPEFLREKSAMQDMTHPSRVIVGYDADGPDGASAKEAALRLGEMILACADEVKYPVFYTGTREAESTKLFSNSYLATRIAFFNALDSFAKERGMRAEEIIQGVCMDPRIGDWYNVPGPGYGGACLPKDISQLATDFGEPTEPLLRGVMESNEKRKAYARSQEA